MEWSSPAVTRKYEMRPSESPAPGPDDRRFTLALAAILGFGVVLRLAFIATYFNLDWEPDGYQHVVINKAIFAHLPDSLWLGIGVWAKPLYTYFFGALYQLLPQTWPAVVVTQVTNTVLWTACAWVTIGIARAIFRQRATVILIAVICALTFVSFRASITANTEPIGALVFALGLYFWTRERIFAALLLLGLVIGIRTDGIFCVAVFALVAMARPLLAGQERGWLTALLRGTAFALPTALWDLAGFIQTGSPLFVYSHGYPPVIGKYGSGTLSHFFVEFLRFDTVMFTAFLVGSMLVLIRGSAQPAARTLRPALAAAMLYLVAMILLWWFGAFGSAGLLRYFVFCYPIYILLAGVAIDAGLTALPRASWRSAVVAALSLVIFGQLHWLLREPKVHHGVLTRVPISAVRDLPKLNLPWADKPVYCDTPDVIYYLGHDAVYQADHPLNAVLDPKVTGIFVYIPNHDYGGSTGVTPSSFDGMTLDAQFLGPYGESFYVYER